jgi:SAM-dependent methyltransferase
MNEEHLQNSVVSSFGHEWDKFKNEITDDQRLMFSEYFSIFPWDNLPLDAAGFDVGCGSGRFAFFVAPRVGHLYCVDPSEKALAVAKQKLSSYCNCSFLMEPADSISVPDASLDFGYCLGVLHHVTNTTESLCHIVQKLKPGAPFLLYLYYRLENRPAWFRLIWRLSNLPRVFISALPFHLKAFICEIIAALIYLPAARFAGLLEKLGVNVSLVPLSYYRDKSFYILRNDALDRFGTKLEKRFTRPEIEPMMKKAGLANISFRNSTPYWVAVGFKS